MVKEGYKQTEIGVIPEDWKLMASGEFIEVLTDFTANGSFASLAENVTYLDYPDYARLVRLTDIRTNFKNQGIYVSKDSYEFLAKSSLFGGELLLANVGAYAGYSFLFQKIFQEYATLGPNMFLIKANKNILREEYVPLVFGHGSVFKQLIEAAASSAQPKINKDNVRKSVAIIPPLKEQERIAEALSDVDAMISSLEKLIAKKKAVKQGAMQELLTGKKRLPGFHGQWSTINLSKKSKIKSRIGWQGLTTNEYLDDGFAYLVTGTDFVNGRIDWDDCYYVAKERFDQDKNIQIQNDDILITKDGSLGKTALVKGLNKPATLNSGVFVIRPIQDSYDPTFVYYILSSFVFKDFLDHLSAGSTIIHLYQKDISKFEFLVPPTIEEQTAIALILSDMDNEIEALEQKLEKARQIKQGMMQQLLTGKIRLV